VHSRDVGLSATVEDPATLPSEQVRSQKEQAHFFNEIAIPVDLWKN
jgi:hypothetical protein